MIEALKLPTKVIESDWKDDIDFEPFENEAKYVSPTKEKSTAEQAKSRNIKIGRIALFGRNEKLAA